MPRLSTQFVCQQCGYSSPKWMGQCPNCGTWNSLVETVVSTREKGKAKRGKEAKFEPVRLSDVKKADYERRVSTGIGEIDRVLGGGIVPGMVVLVAGEPGIGKSTLLLQVADKIGGSRRVLPLASPTAIPPANKHGAPSVGLPVSRHPSTVIYVAGEESASQIANRAARLGVKGSNIQVLEETDVDGVIEIVSSDEWRVMGANQSPITNHPSLLIVDSIQTLTTSDLAGMAGSVGQVRECAGRIAAWAKRAGVPAFLVGHVTKEGTIAGPRVLEHMVDTVLWFEGDRSQALRVVRAIKNRFGPTDEVGIFSMEERGLVEVANPSEIFLGERGAVPGSVVTVALEGTRPVLVEIQALLCTTKLAFPRRSASGIDRGRLEIIVAVLGRRVGLPLWEYDIFVNVAGGIQTREPAADLAIALAIASAFYDKPLAAQSVFYDTAVADSTVAVGEVGLLGEVREVMQLDRRAKEAKRLGFTKVISHRQVKTVSEAIRKYIQDKKK